MYGDEVRGLRTDGVKDGTESDVDCGGTCPGCFNGKKCVGNADCASGVCDSGMCVDYLTWLERFGGMSATDSATAIGLGVDATGNSVLAVHFEGLVSLGGTSYNTTPGRGWRFRFRAARLRPAGAHLWDVGLRRVLAR